MGEKIKKSELVTLIQEEVAKFKKSIALKKELSEVTKQLKSLTEGEVAEVVAGPVVDAKKNDGVYAGMHKPVFQKKGSALIEDKDGDEMSDAVANEESAAVDKEAIMAALKTLGQALGLKGEIEFDGSDEDEAEVNAATEEGTEEEGAPEEEEEEGSEEEVTMEAAPAKEEEGHKEEEEAKTVAENLDEPIEGHSVAQMTADSKVDDGMEKDKHVKENAETSAPAPINEELNRMKKLAGLK